MNLEIVAGIDHNKSSSCYLSHNLGAMKMASFESHLSAIVMHAQQRVHPRAFAMFQPPYLTIAYFEQSGALHVLADTKIDSDYTKTFTQLYSQLRDYNSKRGTEF